MRPPPRQPPRQPPTPRAANPFVPTLRTLEDFQPDASLAATPEELTADLAEALRTQAQDGRHARPSR